MKFLFLSLTTLVLMSCNSNSVYKKIDKDFSDNRWQKSNVREFMFEINDTIPTYDLNLLFSHVAGFQFDLIPVRLSITHNEETYTESLLIRTKDAQGDDRGDCLGDYCDLEQVIFSGRKLGAGSYTVQIANEFPHKYLPNIIGLGIEVLRSEE